MTEPLHLPVLRGGQPYFSLQTTPLRDLRDGSSLGVMSQALPGVIARDLERESVPRRRALEAVPVAELLAICRRAADLVESAELPLYPGADVTFSPDDYLEALAATTGMPIAMGRANLAKVVHGLRAIEQVLDGLTRGLDLGVLDGGWGEQSGRRLSYQRQADALGAILPNNSPGVHNLWLPAIPLKTPVVLKPGSAEPWTPYRVAVAMIEAGCPREAFSLYPTTHGGVPEILLRTGRSLFFGDASTVDAWRGTGQVQVHGPGWSKVILGPDAAADWRDHLDLLVSSVARNGGRSCINGSGVWTPSHGTEIARAMAERLAEIEPHPLDHPEAALAAQANPRVAHAISNLIDAQLGDPNDPKVPAAIDRSREARCAERRDRVAEVDGLTFLRPTVIEVRDPNHPLAAAEYGFPFASVVEHPVEGLFEAIGPTLVGSVISNDEDFLEQALAARTIDRLNLGPIPTYEIAWDQPHEGNLFDHLYQQRAFQVRRREAA